MTNEVKNVPELRFSDFSEEWKSEKLGNISDRVKRKNQNLESKMPLTISGNLGLVDQVTYFSKSVSAKNLENYTLIKKGEFAYNKSYSNGYPLGAIKRLEKYDKGVLSTLYICFRFNENQNTEYMKQYFETSKWHKEVSAIAVEGARNHGLLNISVNEFFTVLLSIPSLNEQNKIGEFFNKLDRQIELEEQKLSLLEEQKKGYMQKLFSQELRFKDENGDDYPEWMETNIRNTFDNKGGTALEKEFDNNGTHKVISIGSYSMNSTYNEQNLRINKNEFTEKYLLNEGDLAMVLNDKTKEGNIIGKSIYIDEDDKYIYNQRTERLIPVTGNNHKFLWYLMNSEQFRKKIKQMMQGATQVYINYNSIKDLSIYLPILEEQNKIENFLGDIFNIIKNQSDKVELLKRRKKGFLQKMFV
ncbi:restriction endonuclease subunit S [Staphylococcus equorum]|uniref:restriction endonuclease subunit S n=1 Tax=Staphylococcus equorum TaxID=246432 RepID=UPI0008061D5C|nr:restriction endonuclease subunit S [Staphylococcus equorum]ANQ65721.1 hypothetical protein AVJ22_13785 [Staphylococcus equorum]